MNKKIKSLVLAAIIGGAVSLLGISLLLGLYHTLYAVPMGLISDGHWFLAMLWGSLLTAGSSVAVAIEQKHYPASKDS